MQSTSTAVDRTHDHTVYGCDDEHAKCCVPGEFTRLRYAYGLRLGAVELSDEQSYLVGKHRFHNARCHGPGVLCGLRVGRFVWPQGASEDARSTMLRVWRGAAMDGCGREVLVPCDQCIDVAAWFAETRGELKLDHKPPRLKIWVGLRYRECPSDPTVVPRDPCGCDSGGCAYTRVREGFELRLFAGEPLPHCPGRGCQPPSSAARNCSNGSSGSSRNPVRSPATTTGSALQRSRPSWIAKPRPGQLWSI